MAAILAAGVTLSVSPSYSSKTAMNGPPAAPGRHHAATREPETSTVTLLALGALRFYRNVISPTQASRCGFYPSCSAFGLQAVHEHGPLRGVMMTADRLTRCNLLKGPGPDYYLLPGGKLLDPVSSNLLAEP